VTIVIIRSFAAAEELFARLLPPVGLLKFPRTEHIVNLGAATSDDLVDSAGVDALLRLDPPAHVVITEKVDGANMGFSLSGDRTKILVQNRSHYVNPSYHEQFKKLGVWIEEHRDDLYRILDRDPHFPQRYILYGEWMAATHSVSYNKLPDWFLAFDLYDRSSGEFVDRETLVALLSQTAVQATPVMYEGSTISKDELVKMVQRPSQYGDGRVEGVYAKVEKDGKVASRGKVVRGDFIVGNEHWSKGFIKLNEVISPEFG